MYNMHSNVPNLNNINNIKIFNILVFKAHYKTLKDDVDFANFERCMLRMNFNNGKLFTFYTFYGYGKTMRKTYSLDSFID